MTRHWNKYADLWLKQNFGNGDSSITEWQAAKYVASMFNFMHANTTERKQLILELKLGLCDSKKETNL